jgi:hypothetical protein
MGVLIMEGTYYGGNYYDALHYATFLEVPSTPSSQVPIYIPQRLLLRYF